jgi:hypothetical protein
MKIVLFFTNRIRVFLFGLTIGILGLISPSKAIREARQAFEKYQ